MRETMTVSSAKAEKMIEAKMYEVSDLSMNLAMDLENKNSPLSLPEISKLQIFYTSLGSYLMEKGFNVLATANERTDKTFMVYILTSGGGYTIFEQLSNDGFIYSEFIDKNSNPEESKKLPKIVIEKCKE